MKRDLDEALRTRLRLLLFAGAVAIVTELLWLCGIGKGVQGFIFDSYLFSACLLAGAVSYLLSDAPKKFRAAALGLGVVTEIAHALIRGIDLEYMLNLGAGFGFASLVVSGVEVLTTREPAARKEASLRLTETSLLAAFLLASPIFVVLTVVLHPTTYDGAFYAAEHAMLGAQPSFFLGRLFGEQAAFRYLGAAVYVGLPVAATAVYAFERRRRPARLDLQVTFVLAGIVGCTLYHLLPVAGPRPAFYDVFPVRPPDPEIVRRIPYLAGAAFRNAIPSLHTTWALLVYWHARPLGRAHQAFGAAWVVLTIVAMLGLGEHYLVDVFVSVPFAVALRAALTTTVPLGKLERWLPIAVGASLFTFWVVLFRASWPGDWNPDMVVGLAVASLLVPLVLEHRLHALASEVEREAPPPVAAEPASTPVRARTALVVAVIFFASGFAGLVYEVMFAKSLALVFGSTSTASSTVLATYMGGMALGSVVGGRIRTKSALRAYAYCEVGVGFACAVAPLLVKAIRAAYVAAATGADPGRPGVVALQVALGALVLLPPTIMMGMTMPVLGRFFQKEDPSLGRSVGMLYAANTLGAAVGAFTTGYLLIPSFGIFRTTLLAVALNLGVALAAIRLDAKRADAIPAAEAPEAAAAPEAPVEQAPRAVFAIGLAVLALGGVVTLALEVTYTHLLAIVVGNSTFAFSSMLTAFLVGLGGGAALGRAWLRKTGRYVLGVTLAQGGVVLTVLVGVFLWNSVPSYFASYAGYPYARTFASSELIRFAVCCGLLVPPALCIGASYPLAVESVVRGSRGDAVRALGTAGAANTAGNITGALLATFVLMPRLGSLRSLHVLMAASLLLAAATLLGVARAERKVVVAVLALALGLFAIQPRSFDLTRLANGANVYFLAQGYGRTIDHAESSEGGLTTVAISKVEGTEVKTLLTNGKFQGDDSPVREMQAQYGLTLFPMLHDPPRGKALVVGLGTGVTARAVHDAGFAQVDVAELSGDIVDLARRHFKRVNGGVLEGNPAVRTFVTDGRNYLMLKPEQYDFIGLEISSIWFAGAASLYNREFYELTKTRLAPNGVLQQWVQIHHVDVNDIITMLASLRSVYPRAWFYVAGGQGVAVACFHDCSPTAESLARIDDLESLRPGLALLGGRSAELLKFRVLTPESLDKLLAAVGADPKDPERLGTRVSTDDNLFLEYSTPRGNMRPYKPSMDANVAYLRKFSPPDVLAGTHLSPEAIAPRKAPEPATAP